MKRADVALQDIEGDAPFVDLSEERRDSTCRLPLIIVGCDGFHGPSRKAIPATAARLMSRSIRSAGSVFSPMCRPAITSSSTPTTSAASRWHRCAARTRSRYYIDVPVTEKVEDWPDERVWDELAVRLGPDAAAHMARGPSLEKSIAPLRRFCLRADASWQPAAVRDAAHIVPPTGAKGLNLAASDVLYAAQALPAYFKRNDGDGIAGYSAKALARVWKAERFSWSLTKLMHRFPEDGPFERAMQLAELDYIASSHAAQTSHRRKLCGVARLTP